VQNAASVQSFEEYRSLVQTLTTNISALHGLRFGTWCIRRFLEVFGENNDLWDGLTVAERQQLAVIMAELETAAVTGELIGVERAAWLEAILELLGSPDEDDLPRVEPLTVSWLTMIDHTLIWSRHGLPSSLCAISEEFINALDYEQDDPEYRVETMFTFPALTRELQLQAAFLEASSLEKG
jgi:hypothetical protein